MGWGVNKKRKADMTQQSFIHPRPACLSGPRAWADLRRLTRKTIEAALMLRLFFRWGGAEVYQLIPLTPLIPSRNILCWFGQ